MNTQPTTQVPLVNKPLIIRQCGTRHDGATYIQSDGFSTLETLAQFFIDSQHPTDTLNLPSLGMTLVLRPGTEDDPIYDVYDVIGRDSYPNVWDFIYEVKAHGVSRKISKSLLKHITPGKSMHIMVHDHGMIHNPMDDDLHIYCPTGESLHLDTSVNCIDRLRWAQEMTNGDTRKDGREYMRQLACGEEYAAAIPKHKTQFEQAAFMWMPITRFEVVQDVAAQTHDKAISVLQGLGFDFDLVDN